MDKNITTNQYPDALKLYFNPRTWRFNKDCPKNVGNRMFLEGPDGKITEGFMIGDWNYSWTEIVSETLTLEKNKLYTFSFWLNGGENDRNSEVCRFEVVFDDDHENRCSYNLNRSFIRPALKLNNWEYYEIPFTTMENETTQLRFVAQAAYMTVMAAGPKEQYLDIPDHSDPYAKYRPQRHNIVFEDGFPVNTWYSTEKMALKYGTAAAFSYAKDKVSHLGEKVSEIAPEAENAAKKISHDTINAASAAGKSVKKFIQENVDVTGIKSALTDLKGKLKDIINTDSNPDDIADKVDDIAEQVDDIAEQVDDIAEQVDDIADQIDDITDQIDDVTEESSNDTVTEEAVSEQSEAGAETEEDKD